jgi:hypothetical protein
MYILPGHKIRLPAAAGTDGASSVRHVWKRAAAVTAAGVAAVTVTAVGAALGWWFLPFVVGAAAGTLAYHRFSIVLIASATVAAAGWAVPLLWQAGSGVPIGATARAVAAFAGLPASGALIVAATLLLPVIQAVVGAWLAHALGYWRGNPK